MNMHTKLLSQCLVLSLIAASVSISGCATVEVYDESAIAANGEPAYVTVKHCLISFEGTKVEKAVRSREEAEQLANELFEKAKGGEDFDKIIRQYTDDSPPGIYQMANHGFEDDTTPMVPSNKVYARGEMVAAFGDVGFPLKVGEFGLAPYDPKTSPFGWHIIQRTR